MKARDDISQRELDIIAQDKEADNRYFELKACAEDYGDGAWPFKSSPTKPMNMESQDYREFNKQFEDFVFGRRKDMPKLPGGE